MKTVRLILVGGFLGSGKTTLLWETASRLTEQGKKIGLITNDQSPELVDTALLLRKNLKVAEVSGSCFCCNYNGFAQAVNEARTRMNADIVIAEPVGSCTDLSATLLQPLKKMNCDLLVSPLSVLADPEKLGDIIQGGTAGLHPSAAYIFKKQLEESDIIVISKSDLIDSTEKKEMVKKVKEKFPRTEIMNISVKTGEGISEWINEVISRNDSGKYLAEVDYDTYAEGEAVLGWLNATLEMKGTNINWDNFGKNLMKKLNKAFEKEYASIGHVKMILENERGYLTANLTGHYKTLSFNGSCGITKRAKLTLNARVEAEPKKLEFWVKQVIKNEVPDKIEVIEKAWSCISPGRPEPTYRFNYIVPEKFLPPDI